MGKGSISTTMRAAVEKLRFGVGDEDEPLRTSPTLAADRTLAQLDYLCSI
jgi:hypothetical protein